MASSKVAPAASGAATAKRAPRKRTPAKKTTAKKAPAKRASAKKTAAQRKIRPKRAAGVADRRRPSAGPVGASTPSSSGGDWPSAAPRHRPWVDRRPGARQRRLRPTSRRVLWRPATPSSSRGRLPGSWVAAARSSTPPSTRSAIDVAGRHVLDVGASTGGFTDCLLQRGARRVVALDVGHGQLHPRIRHDDRVVVLERTNVRDALPATIGGRVELVVADVSFISLAVIIPVLVTLCQPGSPMVLLVKPQFEAGRAEAARGRGVITDPAIHDRVAGERDGRSRGRPVRRWSTGWTRRSGAARATGSSLSTPSPERAHERASLRASEPVSAVPSSPTMSATSPPRSPPGGVMARRAGPRGLDRSRRRHRARSRRAGQRAACGQRRPGGVPRR